MIMLGKFSYLFSIVLFAGIPLLVQLVFGYHLIKSYFRVVLKWLGVFLWVAPFFDTVAITLNAWAYPAEKNVGIFIFQSPIETTVFTVFVGLVIAFTIIIWSHYEDKGKPIIQTSIYDIIHETYAIWKKK